MRTLISSLPLVAVALAAAAPAAVAQAPQNRICMIVGNDGQARCAWQSLAQCERAARRGENARCFDRTYMLAATPGNAGVEPERPVPQRRRAPLR